MLLTGSRTALRAPAFDAATGSASFSRRPRNGRRAPRRIQARRNRGAALHVVRRRCARIPAREQRGGCARHRCGRLRENRRCARLPALHTVYCIGDDAPDQPDGSDHPGVLLRRGARRRNTRLRAGRYGRRRSGGHHLYVRHDGQAEGALHAHRVLLGHLPGVEMSQQCFRATRACSDARRLGMDRRPARRAAAVMASRRAVLARRFEKFDGDAAFRADGAARCHPRIPAAHRAEADAHRRGARANATRCR